MHRHSLLLLAVLSPLAQAMQAPAERDAALATTTQPSRAILLRSAAWLAVNAGDHAEALRLADIGLSDPTTGEREHHELQAVAQAATKETT